MADYAVMPFADYQDACDAVREKTGGTESIKSGDLGAQIRAITSETKCKITLNGVSENGSGPAAVIINEVVYLYEDGAAPFVVEVEAGTVIRINLYPMYPEDVSETYINGELVSNEMGYTYTITENAVVSLVSHIRAEITTSGAAAPVIEALEITENGTYTAPAGVDGYSPITVNVETSSGASFEDGIINRSISGAYINDRITSVGQFAFRGCTKITSLSFPNVKSVGSNGIYGCSALGSIDLPLCTSIGENAFNACGALPSIVLPSLTSGGSYMFRYCYLLKTVDLAVLKNIVSSMFGDCRRLTAVILRSETMCTLAATSAFSNCYHFYGTTNSTYNPNGDQDGYIYVPSALVEEYKAATNWSTLATQFRALEDYTVDGTITGELDETKI